MLISPEISKCLNFWAVEAETAFSAAHAQQSDSQLVTEAVLGIWLTTCPDVTRADCWKALTSAAPPGGGRVPEPASQSQKSRSGAIRVGRSQSSGSPPDPFPSGQVLST
jgi:hypothetical protein